MNKHSTLQDYSRRLLRVVKMIWQHADQNYTLEQLADAAHFSPYHFHRIYREMMGETVAATQQRLRLLRAARQLACADDIPLERVARRAGFSSSAAFVRAFAATHGQTPGAYRRQRIALLQDQINQELNMYIVQFRTLSNPIHLAAQAHQGPYIQIGEAFSRLQIAKPYLPVTDSKRWFALYHDDPQSVAAAQLRSHACFEVAETGELPAPLTRQAIPVGRYAVIEHVGPYSELETAYHWFFGVWLPASAEKPANVPIIEQYLNLPHDTAPKDLRTEIWLALLG